MIERLYFVIVSLVDWAIRLFAIGLFIYILLEILSPPRALRLQLLLSRLYNPFLNPIRRCIRPFRIFRDSPSAIDISPFILLLIIWLFVHPFIKWVLTGK